MLRSSAVLVWLLVVVSLTSEAMAKVVDVVYTRSRGEVVGQILDENDTSIVIQWTDPVLGIATPLTISRRDIITIERDVEREDDVVDEQPQGLPGTVPADVTIDDEAGDGPAKRVRQGSGGTAEKLYIVPMRGQVGTDIRSDVYEDIIEDIKVKKPDTIVIMIESHDERDIDEYEIDIMDEKGMPDSNDESVASMKDLIKLRRMFAEDLGDTRQICWVKHAFSVASLLALSWDELYMTRDAEFGNGWKAWVGSAMASMGDDDKYGKYIDAMFGDVEGLVIYGGWLEKDRLPFVEAFVIPEKVLSTSWVGREAKWYGDLSGELLLDTITEIDPRQVLQFNGEAAEELTIADGLADSYDDLVALLNAKSYEIVGDASKLIEEHRQGWEQDYNQAMAAYMTFSRFRNSGEVFRLAAALKGIKKYISIINRNSAAKARISIERRATTNKTQLDMMMSQLEERIKAIRSGGRPGGGGGQGGGRGGGRGGGGPRGPGGV